MFFITFLFPSKVNFFALPFFFFFAFRGSGEGQGEWADDASITLPIPLRELCNQREKRIFHS